MVGSGAAMERDLIDLHGTTSKCTPAHEKRALSVSLFFKVWPASKVGRITSRLRRHVRHNDRVTNNEDAGAPSISTGFVVGMMIGIAVGLVLGLAVFDNMAIGLVLGGGAGGVLGVTLPAARRSQRQSS